MTPLDFLYIALGGGFVILVIFLCVMLLNLTLVLRDVSKMTGNFKDVSDRVREVVMEPLKAISEMTASLGFVRGIVEKVRSRFEEVKDGDKCEDCGEEDCACVDDSGEEQEKPKKKGFFSVRKLRE